MTLTWKEIYEMEPRKTAEEAAAMRGSTKSAAQKWASYNGLRWEAPRNAPIKWGEYFNAGYSAHEAARAAERDVHYAKEWARKNGVKWPVKFGDDRETIKRDPKKPRKYAFSCSPRAIKRWEERAGV